MGRMYTAVLSATSIGSAADLLWFQSSSLTCTIVHEIKVSQEAGETSEQLPIAVIYATTSNAAQGQSITPTPVNPGDPAFAGLVRAAVSTLSTVYKPVWRDGQNVINGWHFLPTPETRPILSPTNSGNGRMAVQLPNAPAAALTISAYAVLEEIGG